MHRLIFFIWPAIAFTAAASNHLAQNAPKKTIQEQAGDGTDKTQRQSVKPPHFRRREEKVWRVKQEVVVPEASEHVNVPPTRRQREKKVWRVKQEVVPEENQHMDVPPTLQPADNQPEADHVTRYQNLGEGQLVVATQDINSRVRINHQKVIGRGVSGDVCLGQCQHNNQKCRSANVAVKKIETRDREDRERKLREVRLLVFLSHRNILKLHVAFSCGNALWLTTKYAEGGSLEAFCKHMGRAGTSGILPEAFIGGITRQLLSAVAYMHSLYIVHRDLKHANILLDEEDGQGTVKVADFGVSTEPAGGPRQYTEVCGTLLYMAPEMLATPVKYDEKVDIWAIGITIACLFRNPYPGYPGFHTRNQFYRRIQHQGGLLWKQPEDHVPRLALDFIDACTSWIPGDRKTANQLLEHEFVGKGCDDGQVSSHIHEIIRQKAVTRNVQ